MKSMVIIFCIIISLLWIIPFSWAGDKEELQWKAKALIAESQLRQEQLKQANQAVIDFIKELDQKGFTYKDGLVIAKPKPEAPKTEKKEK